jgi:predicted DNA-binding protein
MINLPEDVEKILDHLSREQNRSAEEIAMNVLCEYVEDREDYKAAVRGYQDYLDSGKKGVSLDQMKKDLGL